MAHSASIFDRAFGTANIEDDAQRRAAQSQGLLSAGLSLLQSNVPSTEPRTFAGNLAGAIQAGQAGAATEQQRGIAQRRANILQGAFGPDVPEGQRPSLNDTFQQLLGVGDLAGASQVAQMISQRGQSRNLIQVRAGDRVELRDPITGDVVQTVNVGRDPGERVQQSTGLLSQFRSQTKGAAVTATNFRKMEIAARGGAANDIALIFNFMKMIDPQSTVREGEAATAREAGSIPDRLIAFYNRIVAGESLSDNQRADFLEAGRGQARAARDSFQQVFDFFGDVATNFGLDPDNVRIDFFKDFTLDPQVDAQGRPLNPNAGPAEQSLQGILDETILEGIDRAARNVGR